MLWRLILKLTFKMSLPVIGILGVLTYGHYLQGGDPAAIWRSVGGGIGTKVTALFDDARRRVGGLGDTVADAAGGASSATGDAALSTNTQVFTWTDAHGQTHFSQSAPTAQEATSIVLDSRTNVLVGFAEAHRPAPAIADTHESGEFRTDDLRSNDPFADGGSSESAGQPRMPGMAGLVSSGKSEGNAAEGVDVEALMKVLQAR